MEGGLRFRPPDPVTMLNQRNLQPSIHESSSDSSYNSSQVREEAIHTAMAEKELDRTRTNVYMGDSSQIRDTRANENISQSHAVQDGQKSSEIPIPISLNQPVTAARLVGESPQRRAQDCNIQEVIRPEFAIEDCNTDRGGHPIEVSSSFQGGNIRNEASGHSTGILATDSGKLGSAEELRLFAQQKNPHREGKQLIQDLGQSSTSNVEDFNKKQGKESGKPFIDNARPTVTPASNVPVNELRRIENDPSKAWVAKEQGNSGVLRPVLGTQNRATNRTDQQ
ncbi:hypothetical protein KY289_013282 [Solanum tuberosum]|nr:hypothetical protein KY289_013282 [Solanum tuberosum]